MPSQAEYGDTTIETAIVVDVDIRRWTVDLGTQHSDKPLFGVPWASPYLHQESGEGFLFMPEVGAQCLLCTPSDGGNSPFIIGYLPIPKKDSYRSNRIDMNPGDMGFMTRDGNFVLARRGGVVQIGSTQIAQRLYIPVNNTIRDFAENYSLTTFGGEMVWEVDDQQDVDGKAPSRYVLRAKEFAEDSKEGKEYFPVVMTIGRTPTGADKTKRGGEQNLKDSGLENVGLPLVELDITPASGPGLNVAIDGSGNIYMKSSGSGRWDYNKDLVYNIGRNRTTTVSGTDTIKAKERVEEYETHRMTYTTSREKGTSKEINVSSAAVGNLDVGSHPAVLGGTRFLDAFSTPGLFIAPSGPVTLGPGFIKAMSTLFSKSMKVGE